MFSSKSKKPRSNSDSTTIIARGAVIRGDVHFNGSLHLEGRVEGIVSADAQEKALFTLSETGSVCGEVQVPRALINGEVEGNIHCSDCLELAANARVKGDVHYKMLEMAAGATVNGRMVHETGVPAQLTQFAEAEGTEGTEGVDEDTDARAARA